MIVFDTETTGLVERPWMALNFQPELIEIAAVRLSPEGVITDRFESLVRPSLGLVPDEVTKITTITSDMVAAAPAAPDVLENFYRFVGDEAEIVAHNAAFDLFVMDCEAARYGKSFIWPRIIDTIECGEVVCGFRPSLTVLHEQATGEPTIADAHRAMPDVEALVRVIAFLKTMGVWPINFG